MTETTLVFATQFYESFARSICRNPRFELGHCERNRFPDGERSLRLTCAVRDRDAIVVGGTHTDAATLELYDLATGLVQYGANKLTLVVPYYGYSTMERMVHYGDVVTGKSRAVLLSSIPPARICNEIVLIDLHTSGIAHYFEGQLRPFHLSSKGLVADLVRGFTGWPDLILASTDAGRAKWIEHLANVLDVPAAFVYKRRASGSETVIRGINADVKNRHVVIYDDMIRTGGSLLKAAQAYADAGAKQLTAIATHGVLPGDALMRLRNGGLFDAIYVADTHPRVAELRAQQTDDFLRTFSVIPLVQRFLLDRHIDGHDPLLEP